MKLKKGIERIKELLYVIKDTDIEEIYFEKDGLNIGVKKKITEESPVSETEQKEEKPEQNEKEIVEVVSHCVGLFRDALPPARKPLAKVGQSVNKGQKIGFIESTKIMKEVVSPVKGVVLEKFVKYGAPVEYGQKLFDIEVV